MEEEKGNTIELNIQGTHTLDYMSKQVLNSLYDLAMRFPMTNTDGTFKITIEFYPDSEVENE